MKEFATFNCSSLKLQWSNCSYKSHPILLKTTHLHARKVLTWDYLNYISTLIFWCEILIAQVGGQYGRAFSSRLSVLAKVNTEAEKWIFCCIAQTKSEIIYSSYVAQPLSFSASFLIDRPGSSSGWKW